MRARVSKHMAEYRVVKRYHRLYVPLIELIQSLQDLAPNGAQLSEKVELEQGDGFVSVSYTTKPVELIIVDGSKRFVLKVEETSKKPKERPSSSNLS
jgi:hypothetical protein